MKRFRVLTRALALGLATASVALLTACSPIVSMKPAPDANNPNCADVIVRLPDSVQGLDRRETDAQATGAWGDPTAVLLRCGVEVPAASPLPCVVVDGVYWLRDDSAAPTYVYRSYGRDPAIDVAIDQDVVTPGLVLSDLSSMVARTHTNGHECTDIEDSL